MSTFDEYHFRHMYERVEVISIYNKYLNVIKYYLTMNKITILITFITVSISRLIAFDASDISKGEYKRIELIAEQMQKGQQAIWPTLNWSSAPLIVTFENGHFFAFHLNSQDPAWQKITIKGMEVQIANEDRWGLKELQMQAWFEIEGKKAFTHRLNEVGSALEDVLIMAHERFHRHQGEHFITKEAQGISQDHLNEENLAWAEMEDLLLRDFLGAEKDNKLELIKDFIAVNQMRRNALEEESLLWENGQLRMEGLADYVSTKAFGGEKDLLRVHPLEENIDEFIDDMIKWRHYMAGAALGYALDFLEVKEWKEKVESGENLADLLAKNVPLTKEEQKSRLIKVSKRLNYKKRRRNAASKIENYHNQLDTIYANYENKEGISLFVAHPRLPISGGGLNERIIHMEEGGTVAINDASLATTPDGSWKFETINVSHLFMHRDGVREVKMEGNGTIQMDQESLKLNDAMTLSQDGPKEFLFHSLELTCENVRFSSEKHPGVLIVDPSGVYVRAI